MSTPITAGEMAGNVQMAVNLLFPDVADAPHDMSFEFTTPATGQRFRVTVAEIPAWSEQLDSELEEVIRTETAS